MRYTWDPTKHRTNARDHALDLAEGSQIFHGPTYTFEDDRFYYGEQRWVTLGLFHGEPVTLVHTETDDEIHGISFRKATKRESRLFFENFSY